VKRKTPDDIRLFRRSFALSFTATLLLVALVLAGCGDPAQEMASENRGPSIVSGGGGYGEVKEVRLSDGTRCVVLIGSSKGGISCDWK